MHPRNTNPTIKYLIFMGDSLSDRDTFAKRQILYGLIPNNLIVDLSKSPHGRFTNGFTWDDYLCEMLVSRFLAKKIETETKLDAEDISDAVIDRDPQIEPKVQAENTLEIDTRVDNLGERFARSYCEGGLTAHNYSRSWVFSFTLMLAREIVATLDEKRTLLLSDDKRLAVSDEEKQSTLVIEWSGANDLLTVNARPTIEEADSAITARLRNITELYKNGYRHFHLLNLPEIDLTPRFQDKKINDNERENAKKVCAYFNKKLKDECLLLQEKYPGISVEVFDINNVITKIYENPEHFGFDKTKLKTPFINSSEYNMAPNHTSHAEGYLFWDDIHPTAKAHAKLALAAFHHIEQTCQFSAPPPTAATDARRMFEKFMHLYKHKLKSDKESIFSMYGTTTYDNLLSKLHAEHATIDDSSNYPAILAIILQHGIHENGARTRGVLLELGWIDSKNVIAVSNPALAAAKNHLDTYAETKHTAK